MSAHTKQSATPTHARNSLHECVAGILDAGVLPAPGVVDGQPVIIEAIRYEPHSVGFWFNTAKHIGQCRLSEARFDDEALEAARANAVHAILHECYAEPITDVDALRANGDHLCALLQKRRAHIANLVKAEASEHELADAIHTAASGIELLMGMEHHAECVEHAVALARIAADAYRLRPGGELANAAGAAATCAVAVDTDFEWGQRAWQDIVPLLTNFDELGIMPYLLAPGSAFLSAVMAQEPRALHPWREALSALDACAHAACALEVLAARSGRQLGATLHTYLTTTISEAARLLLAHICEDELQHLNLTLQRVDDSPEKDALVHGLFGTPDPGGGEDSNTRRAAALANPSSVALLEWADHAGYAFLEDPVLRPTMQTLYVLCMRHTGYTHLLGTLVESLTIDALASHSSWTLQDLAPFLLRHEEFPAAITTYAALALRHANRGKPTYYSLGVQAIRTALSVGEEHDHFDLADALVCDVIERHSAKYAFHGPAKLALTRSYRRIGME